MKLIDDNGRLFGKINIIDFLVLTAAIGFTVWLIYAWIVIFGKVEYQKFINKHCGPVCVDKCAAKKETYDLAYEDYKRELNAEAQRMLNAEIGQCQAEAQACQARTDNFLREHKRMRKYFR